MKLSIIIPTLNEERYLPKLLDSIHRQTYDKFEVIVSDSYSEDNTVKIAEEFGAKVVLGPKKGPGYARNLGAKHAKGDILVFFDADVILKRIDTLEEMVNLLKERKEVVGGTWTFKAADGDKKDRFLTALSCELIKRLYMVGIHLFPGFAIFCRKEYFNKIGGFDENVLPCEDWDFAERLSKVGKLEIVKVPVWVSTRRLSAQKTFDFIKNYLGPGLYYLILRKNPKEKFRFIPASSLLREK